MPEAVTLPVQYAVAVNTNGPAGRAGACAVGPCGASGGAVCGGGTCGGGVWGGEAGWIPRAHAETVTNNSTIPAFRLTGVRGVCTASGWRKLRSGGVDP